MYVYVYLYIYIRLYIWSALNAYSQRKPKDAQTAGHGGGGEHIIGFAGLSDIPLFDSSKKPCKIAVPVPSDETLASRPVRTQRWHGVVEESTGHGNGVGKDHIPVPVPVTVCIFPPIHI